jgi:hypothetical protein
MGWNLFFAAGSREETIPEKVSRRSFLKETPSPLEDFRQEDRRMVFSEENKGASELMKPNLLRS